MAKYTINRDLDGEASVEADFYELRGDYFYFFKGGRGDGEVVLAIASRLAHTIWAEESPA